MNGKPDSGFPAFRAGNQNLVFQFCILIGKPENRETLDLFGFLSVTVLRKTSTGEA